MPRYAVPIYASMLYAFCLPELESHVSNAIAYKNSGGFFFVVLYKTLEISLFT